MDWIKLSTIKITGVYRRLLFNHCYICHIKSEHTLCEHCQLGFTTNTPCCQHCKQPLSKSKNDILCGQCQTTPPRYHLCIAPYQFEGIMKNLIHRVKFGQENHYVRPLTYLLSKQLIKEYSSQPWPEQLLYVPSHPKTIKQRGFCQTHIMAKQIIKSLKETLGEQSPQLPHPNPINKHKSTHAQHALKRKERLTSPYGSYEITSSIAKHIALFDDVMTTGSTINACCHLLKKHGAERIDVWVLARTPDTKTDHIIDI